MITKLVNPSDEELNAAFAEKVAKLKVCDCGGWSHLIAGASMIRMNDLCKENCCPSVPRYTTYADAVLPWLYKRHWEVQQTSSADKPIRVVLDDMHGPSGQSDTFPRAAVLALLCANGVEVH